MCLSHSVLFGEPPTDDDHHYHDPASRTQQPHGQRNNGAHYTGNSTGAHGNGNGNGYPKASNDASRDHVHVVPAGGWHGHGHAATGGAQEKMAASAYPYARADGTLKQQPAAPNGRVAAADGARDVAHSYYYYDEREPPAAHKEDAADSYYRAAADTADRY